MRWTAPDKLHLTLRFLGDTPAARVEALLAGLEGAAAGRPAPRLRLGPMGAFPDRGRPQVLWAGVEGETDALAALQGAVEGVVTALGFDAETRPYRPHLTLGRVKKGQRPPDDWACEPPALEFVADTLELVHSRLGPGGARYSVLGSRRLTG